MEEFKNCYRLHLQEERAQEFVGKKNEALLSAITENADVEVTKDMVDAEVDRMLLNLEQDLKKYGVTVEQFFESQGTTKEAEKVKVRDVVKENVKRVLVIEKIMELENLAATDEDVENFLKGSPAPQETIDKEGVKINLSYANVLTFLDANTEWTD
ncbi:MAG: hypothetical protein MJ072_01305 [Clostridia bacterium]|nr:hypothetical protein [Clostridia bacterium]